jgi:stage II sporulation protein D
MRRIAKLTALVTLPVLAVGLSGAVTLQAQAATAVPQTFSFSGGGWGHGVGMSQYGALGMAKEGAAASTILRHFYTGTTVGAYGDSAGIRVNLAHRTTGVKLKTEAIAAGGGSVSLNLGASKVYGKAGDVFGLKVSGTGLAVTKNGAAQGGAVPEVVVKWSGTRVPGTTPGDDTKSSLVNLVGTNSSFTSAGHRYRYGYVKAIAKTVGGVTRLEVVNVVSLHDEYLRGLAEVPSSWPAAALQAQVIAARSYALVKVAAGKRSACECHVDSGSGPYYDQVFAGYVKETSSYGSSWRAAVNATHKSATTSLTVLYQGKPAQAFYSSSTGGRTQNSKDVWGGDLPYLKSVDDRWSTQAKYNPTFASWGPYNRTQAQVAKAFGLPNVVKLDLSARYDSTALKSAVATSSSGKTASLGAGTFVSRLSLTSNWVYRTGERVGGTPTDAAVNAGGSTAKTSRTVVIAPSRKSLSYLANIAAPLAVKKKAPLLLSGKNSLPTSVKSDLRKRKANRAYLVGAKSQLSSKLTAQLRSMGVSVTRLGGDRYSASVRVAKAMGTTKGTRVLVVSGTDRASALIASAPAARLGRPLLLVRKTSVPSAVRSYLKWLKPAGSTVVGTKSAVSTKTLRKLPRAVRVSGSTPAATSVAVAKYFGTAMAATSVVLTSSSNVSASRAQAVWGAPVLVTPTRLDSGVRTWLQTNPRVTRVRALAAATPASTMRAARFA